HRGATDIQVIRDALLTPAVQTVQVEDLARQWRHLRQGGLDDTNAFLRQYHTLGAAFVHVGAIREGGFRDTPALGTGTMFRFFAVPALLQPPPTTVAAMVIDDRVGGGLGQIGAGIAVILGRTLQYPLRDILIEIRNLLLAAETAHEETADFLLVLKQTVNKG